MIEIGPNLMYAITAVAVAAAFIVLFWTNR